MRQPPLLLVSRIHQFWREAFATCGWDFDDRYPYGQSARNRSAFYIFSHQHPPPPEVSGALYYNPTVLYADVHPVTARGVYTSEITLAHEIGHRVQDLLGTAAGRWRQATELEADFFAGAYVNWLAARGEAEPGLITAGNVSRRMKGDAPGTPWNHPQSHGSGIQRGTAFMDGVSNGLPVDFCATLAGYP
jgi:hypothetical protein